MTVIVDGTNGITFPNSTIQASAGSVLQVVNATYSTQVSNATTSYATTGLSASITPKFSTSKILVIVNMRPGAVANDNAVNYQLWRGGASVFQIGKNTNYINVAGLGEIHGNASAVYLDSPATTSSITYTVYFASSFAGTAFNNINADTSSIALMEIAG